MRLTADEILEKFPSMNISGKHYDTVQGRYYGDLPYSILKTEFSDENNRTLCNVEGVDVFIAKCYYPDVVEKYGFHNGSGYRIKGGRVIAGDITIQYGGGNPYQLDLFNDHCGQTGFRISKIDIGKLTYTAYNSPGYEYNPWNPVYCRKAIEMETVERLFRKVETEDEYGEFARLLVQTARGILEKAGKEAA